MNSYEQLHLSRIGEKHNKLTIVEYVGYKEGYKCLCDCGNEVKTRYHELIKGYPSQCRTCFLKENKGRPKLLEGVTELRSVKNTYQQSARQRGLEYGLNDTELGQIISSDCAYCGLQPSNRLHGKRFVGSAYRFSGIDRVDNQKGYVSGNCVPCCSMCNKAKATHSLEEFMAWINRLRTFNGETNDK